MRSLSTPDFVHCIAGFNNAQSNIAQTSSAYKTGYDLGKQDSMINTQDATSACRGFVSDVQWMCEQGYDKGVCTVSVFFCKAFMHGSADNK
ncbi:MAG: hypothetical protein WB988_17505 [Candidatus Nitrosopolaris sp.]|jgi:hypothetical protein